MDSDWRDVGEEASTWHLSSVHSERSGIRCKEQQAQSRRGREHLKPLLEAEALL